jgi:predicted nucleotidyltransferase
MTGQRAYDGSMTKSKNLSASGSLLQGPRSDINRIAASHGARNVRVFGSVSRSEASAASDLDLLVDMAEGRNLFDLVALSDELEERLGIDVDVVTEGSLSPYLRDRILAEAVAL